MTGVVDRNYADTYATAVHEAGHAVAQHRLGHPFLKVTIAPDHREGYLGMAQYYGYSDNEYDAMADGDMDDDEDDELDDDEFDDDWETNEYRRVRRAYREWEEANPGYPNIVSLAGPLAEAYHLRRPVVDILTGGGHGDFEHITENWGTSEGREALDDLARWASLEADTAKLVSDNWPQILAVAGALMERRTLSYGDFLAAIDQDDAELRELGIVN